MWSKETTLNYVSFSNKKFYDMKIYIKTLKVVHLTTLNLLKSTYMSKLFLRCAKPSINEYLKLEIRDF